MLNTVIITTSVGREANLEACLTLIAQQSLPASQILVCDDGSTGGAAVCQAVGERYRLPVEHLWRPPDFCVARSRNLGAAAARHKTLVFLDGDNLLNRQGLAAYQEYLEVFPGHALYGYFGYQLDYISQSYYFPERDVWWCDRRFESYAPSGLVPASNMIRFPHEWAWSGNFALDRDLYLAVGGFDEGFRGWGGEDLDFAWRLIQGGVEIHFFLDAWAEQLTHSRQEDFHTLAPEKRGKSYPHHYIEANYPVRVLYSESGWNDLKRGIAHYLKTERGSPEHPQSQRHAKPLLSDASEKHGLEP